MNTNCRKAFHLILASGSPRRRELLTQAGYSFTVLRPDDDAESPFTGTPEELVRHQARCKGENVFQRIQFGEEAISFPEPYYPVIAACDTIAVCKGEILGKPIDRSDAEWMLRLLSGSRHEVLSGLYLRPLCGKTAENTPPAIEIIERTILEMEPLSEERIFSYLNSGLWCGKAGAFGYQDGNDWLTIIDGSESNVVGLPMERLAEELQRLL